MDDLKSYINIKLTNESFGEIRNTRSKVVLTCKCGESWPSRVDIVKRRIRDKIPCLCKSCKVSSYWENPDYKEKLKGIINNRDQKTLQKISDNQKKIWEDKEYLKNQKLKHIEKWNNSDFLKKELGRRRSPESRIKSSITSKRTLSNPSVRKKLSLSMKKKWKEEGYKKKHIESGKKQWENEDYRKKMAKVRSEIFIKNISSIEKILHNILTTFKISYSCQNVIGPYTFDSFVPSHNLLVECQGEYRHSLEKSKRNDAAKFTYINEYFPHLKILYLYERDFLNPGIIKQKLIRELFEGEYKEEQINFEFSNVEVKQLDPKIKLEHSYYSAPEEFLQSYHYAGFGRSAKKTYGAFLEDKLIAVCKFAGIVRKEVATSMNLIPSGVFELDRFCIHPAYQKKNFASWFISRCSKLVFEEFPKVQCLVSFADSTFGHSGTIYKASNWIEVHKTKPSYHYISSDGFVIHKKTLWNHAIHMKKSESEYAEEHSYVKVMGKEKTKFILKREL